MLLGSEHVVAHQHVELIVGDSAISGKLLAWRCAILKHAVLRVEDLVLLLFFLSLINNFTFHALVMLLKHLLLAVVLLLHLLLLKLHLHKHLLLLLVDDLHLFLAIEHFSALTFIF